MTNTVEYSILIYSFAATLMAIALYGLGHNDKHRRGQLTAAAVILLLAVILHLADGAAVSGFLPHILVLSGVLLGASYASFLIPRLSQTFFNNKDDLACAAHVDKSHDEVSTHYGNKREWPLILLLAMSSCLLIAEIYAFRVFDEPFSYRIFFERPRDLPAKHVANVPRAPSEVVELQEDLSSLRELLQEADAGQATVSISPELRDRVLSLLLESIESFLPEVADKKKFATQLLEKFLTSFSEGAGSDSANLIFEWMRRIALREGAEESQSTPSGRVLVIRFNSGSASVTPSGLALIEEIVDQRQEGHLVTVTGYADRVGDESYNSKLAWDRARNVRDILLVRGVPAEFIFYFGSTELSTPYLTIDGVGEPENRRVEIALN